MKVAREEFLAVIKLLNRSSIDSIPSQIAVRNLSTSIRLFEKQENQKQSEKNENQAQKSSAGDQKSSDEGNKKTDDNEQRKKDKKSIDDKDRQNNTNKALALLTKTILWMCLLYSISFTLLVVSSILGGSQGSGGQENHIVSWKEFVQYMLASGEVREIIVRPQYDYVRIVLHDGAIIKGRRPRFNSYMLTVPNIERFEQRLREVEKSMGIAEGKGFYVRCR